MFFQIEDLKNKETKIVVWIDENNIKAENQEYLESCFLNKRKTLKSEDPRKLKQFSGLVKAVALLNAPFRMVDGKVTATKSDIDEATKLWKKINESEFYGVPPQALDVYKNDIIPIYTQVNKDKGLNKEEWTGITMDELACYYYKREGIYPPVDYYRHNFIPVLRNASLISYEKSQKDRRKMLIEPLVFD